MVALMILKQFSLKGNNKSWYGMETKEYIILGYTKVKALVCIPVAR